MPQTLHAGATACAKAIVDRVGRDVRLAVPIGIGKPIALLDALYDLAHAEPDVRLSIFTGLSLSRPRGKSLIQRRFLDPLLDRVLGSYREPKYVRAMREGSLPGNVVVHEFFLQAGSWTRNAEAQQTYTSLNYSQVAQHLQALGTNVMAQIVARCPQTPARVSLGSNTDITLDMFDYVAKRRQSGAAIVVACEVHPDMPFILGDAELDLGAFDICCSPEDPQGDLFAVPKQPISLQDYAMALHAATLIPDDGTLQIGIGTLSDALSCALILRHTRNEVFREMLLALGPRPRADAQLAPFSHGLYGCTELMVDGYLALMDAGILKRRVRDEQGRMSILDAGFFIGSRAFYARLHALGQSHVDAIRMRAISFTNTLDGPTEAKRAARRNARFVNTAMTVTLTGSVSSDATADGHVVSGVGGQLDFILQAHALDDARSIIAVRSTRSAPLKSSSNIVWSYANCTVPRSLRDLFVTEYGIADVRGKSDRDTIEAIIEIADAQFQPHLIAAAKKARKLEDRYVLRERANTPARVEQALSPWRRQGLLPHFPFGSEMSAIEQRLIDPLALIGGASAGTLVRLLAASVGPAHGDERQALQRLHLDQPWTPREWLARSLVLGALRVSDGR